MDENTQNKKMIAARAVFTKPWRETDGPGLARLVDRMGFDGVELPVRPGYQVKPAFVRKGLRQLSEVFDGFGLKIFSVASEPTEEVFLACAENNIDLIRIMFPVSDAGYSATARTARAQLDLLLPLCENYGVRVGIQPHYDCYISDSTGLADLLEGYDPRYLGAIWDAAHDALARKAPEHGLDLVWPWLSMVNFKNAYYRRIDSDTSTSPDWEPYFTDATDGMARWDRAIKHLVERQYSGPICLTAEYTDETDLENRVAEDLRYIDGLIGESSNG